MQALGKKCYIIWHFLPSTLLFLLYFPKFFDDLLFFLHNPLFPFILHPLKNFPPPNSLLPTLSNFHFLGPPKSGGFSAPLPLNLKLHSLSLHPFNLELHPSISPLQPPPPPLNPKVHPLNLHLLPLNLKLHPLNLHLLTSNYTQSTSTPYPQTTPPQPPPPQPTPLNLHSLTPNYTLEPPPAPP